MTPIRAGLFLIIAIVSMRTTAAAQAIQSTAPIGVWNSSGIDFVNWSIGNGFPAGQVGNIAWQGLPPELTTYFHGGVDRKRELNFRGFEINFSYTNLVPAAFDLPALELRNSVPDPAHPLRNIPGNIVYVHIPAIANVIPGGTAGAPVYRVCYLLPAAVSVPGSTPAGNSLAFVIADYESKCGDGNDLEIVGTTNEPTDPSIGGLSFSGFRTTAGVTSVIPNITFSGNLISSEFVVTYLFDNSLIQPVRNSQILTSGSSIPGGGGGPPPFSLMYDDGRGAIFPSVGDVVSYTGNANYPSNVWFTPLVVYSGDYICAGATNPVPEAWNSGPAPIYEEKVAKWIDDFCALTSGCPPGTGAQIDPGNHNFALWLGTDLPTFFNLCVLLNSAEFAAIRIAESGPCVSLYNSAINPTAVLGRNMVNLGGATPYVSPTGITCEQRTILCPPGCGYTPIDPVGPSFTYVGFATIPSSLPPGSTFSIQCWMFNVATNIIEDTTNAVVIRLP
ncbi:MAG: hypothetical protein HY286_20205 [Planctomycetes bacterium]|nr:hypothetical protein [Planctomycetota bacterium]